MNSLKINPTLKLNNRKINKETNKEHTMQNNMMFTAVESDTLKILGEREKELMRKLDHLQRNWLSKLLNSARIEKLCKEFGEVKGKILEELRKAGLL